MTQPGGLVQASTVDNFKPQKPLKALQFLMSSQTRNRPGHWKKIHSYARIIIDGRQGKFEARLTPAIIMLAGAIFYPVPVFSAN